MAGESELSAVDGIKRAFVMHSAFHDQPWPVNDSGGDHGLSRTVENCDTADTAHTVRLPDDLLCRFFPSDSRNDFSGALPRRKKFGETQKKVL